jgi:hypothetical protein
MLHSGLLVVDSTFAVILPAVQSSLNLSLQSVGLLQSVFLVGYLIGQVREVPYYKGEALLKGRHVIFYTFFLFSGAR